VQSKTAIATDHISIKCCMEVGTAGCAADQSLSNLTWAFFP
jgi:hypothetical protein